MGLYNCEDTLVEDFDSIINQTYQRFKIIVCDDGSVNSTFQIAIAYTLNRCLELADSAVFI